MTEDETIDIAIIGGGPSGTYCSWRLKKTFPDKNIQTFEYSDRIGGRLWSVNLGTLNGWDMPDIYGEMGGMRYDWTNQPIVTYIVEKEFADEIEHEVFPMGTKEDGSANQIAFVRNQMLRNSELNSDNIPYNLFQNEKGKTGSEIEAMATSTHFPMLHNPLPDRPDEAFGHDWLRQRVFDAPLMEHGKWNFLQRTISSEAINFDKDTGGYNSSTNANENAAKPYFPKPFMLWNKDYSDLDFTRKEPAGTKQGPYRRPKKGMQHIPLTFHKAATALNVKFHMLHKLVKVEREDKRYKLTFKRMMLDKKDNWLWKENVDLKQGELVVVKYAKKVILAMPRHSIELIDLSGLTNPKFEHNLKAAAKQPAFKLLFGFHFPWWRASGVTVGRSVTDMPIRQVYYFQTVDDKTDNTNSLFMASYNDSTTVAFWKGLEKGDLFTPTELKAEDREGLPLPREQMVHSAMHQVKQMHSLVSAPKPYVAAYQDWTADPYGAGYHAWKPGYDYQQVQHDMLKPMNVEEIYVTGSCFSDLQGWTEGALEASERLLTLHFGVKPLIGQLGTKNGSYPWTKQNV